MRSISSMVLLALSMAPMTHIPLLEVLCSRLTCDERRPLLELRRSRSTNFCITCASTRAWLVRKLQVPSETALPMARSLLRPPLQRRSCPRLSGDHSGFLMWARHLPGRQGPQYSCRFHLSSDTTNKHRSSAPNPDCCQAASLRGLES